MGEWSDGIEGAFGIYPSSKSGEVCILPPFSAKVQAGFIHGNTISYYDGNQGYDAMSIIYNLGREKVMGVKFTEQPSSKIIPFFARPPALPSSQRAQIFEARGCQVAPPETKVADNRSTQIDGQTGAVNLGGSSYFSWGLLKSGSRDNNQPQIIMGYACRTQNQLQGISKRASVTHYVIKRGRGTDDWWLESSGGVVVKLTDSGYVPEKVSGISGNELKPYVTDASSGWLKRDMDVDGLGSTCINGGVQSALSYIQRSVSGEPIATKPVEQLQPIAPSGSYAYPSPEEFAQFKKGLKPSPVSLSAVDLKARQDFQAEWQKKNRAIAPYVGAWKTADNQDVYVFPSKVAGRVCVLRSKDGKLSPDLGVSMTTDMRYDGNNGLFKVDTPEVVAGRLGKTQPLYAFYGAIGSPDISSIKGELEQAQCVSELPKGGAIVEKKDSVVKPIGRRSVTIRQ